MAQVTLSEQGLLVITVDLKKGFTESASGKTNPAIDVSGMSRKVSFGTFKGKAIEGSLNVYIPNGASQPQRTVFKL